MIWYYNRTVIFPFCPTRLDSMYYSVRRTEYSIIPPPPLHTVYRLHPICTTITHILEHTHILTNTNTNTNLLNPLSISPFLHPLLNNYISLTPQITRDCGIHRQYFVTWPPISTKSQAARGTFGGCCCLLACCCQLSFWLCGSGIRACSIGLVRVLFGLLF